MYFTALKIKISDQLDNRDIVNGIGGRKYWQHLKPISNKYLDYVRNPRNINTNG